MGQLTTPPTGLNAIEHIVVLMLENRSLDHMLGYLYQESGNATTVFPIHPDTPNAYFMPGAENRCGTS
jgi:phospholipase C